MLTEPTTEKLKSMRLDAMASMEGPALHEMSPVEARAMFRSDGCARWSAST